MKKERIRMVDDSCLFCGSHFGPAGGHLFVGIRNDKGNLISDNGAVCIPHLFDCEIQICPVCVGKLKQVNLL